MEKTYQLLTRILDERLGFLVFNDDQDDFSISDYIMDSITFIEFIVAIEEEIKKELPDDFLDFDLLSSAKGFAEKLNYYLESIDTSET